MLQRNRQLQEFHTSAGSSGFYSVGTISRLARGPASDNLVCLCLLFTFAVGQNNRVLSGQFHPSRGNELLSLYDATGRGFEGCGTIDH
jgi:hypothetical protein